MVLSFEEIKTWLNDLNKSLTAVGRKTMTAKEIEGFATELVRFGYTVEQAKVASPFAVFGKLSNDFREWKMESTYFFPKPLDLECLKNQFITVTDHNAQMNELRRQHALEMAQKDTALAQKDMVYKDACKEISRLKREPLTPPVVSDECKTMTQLALDLLEAKININKLESEIKHLKRDTNSSESIVVFVPVKNHKTMLPKVFDTPNNQENNMITAPVAESAKQILSKIPVSANHVR